MCPWKTGLPGTEALAKITCKLFHLVFWSLSFPPSSFHLSSQPPFLHSAHSFRSTVLRWFTCTEQCLERLGINRSEDHVCTIGLPSIYDSIKRAVLLGWKIAANKRTHIKIVSHRCSAARCSQFSGELSAFALCEGHDGTGLRCLVTWQSDHVHDPREITHPATSQRHVVTYLLTYKESSRLELRKHSFRQRIVDHWNKLPDDVVTAATISTFKRILDIWMDTYGH